MSGGYENFDIQLLPDGDPPNYQLIIRYPGVLPASGRIVHCMLPSGIAGLRGGTSAGARRRLSKSADDVGPEDPAWQARDLDALKEVGGRLFRTLLPGELAGEYGVVADRMASEGGRLRLRIDLTQAPELSSQPWEALYRERTEVLLAIHAATPIVRLLAPPTPADATPVAPPVRLLVFTAVPGGDLDVGRELANIERRTKKLVEGRRSATFTVEVLKKATRSALHEKIRSFKPHFLHYIGHGSFDGTTGWIHLHREDDPAAIDQVDADTLRAMLSNHRPKLVVLNTCEGGMASKIDAFSGMAHALIQRNIPYVIAMQSSISDQAAIAFSDMLYADLADGEPIDIAVTNARNAIRLLKSPEAQVELITPVLYSSGAVDRLIEAGATEGQPANPERAHSKRWLYILGGSGAIFAALIVASTYIASSIDNVADQIPSGMDGNVSTSIGENSVISVDTPSDQKGDEVPDDGRPGADRPTGSRDHGVRPRPDGRPPRPVATDTAASSGPDGNSQESPIEPASPDRPASRQPGYLSVRIGALDPFGLNVAGYPPDPETIFRQTGSVSFTQSDAANFRYMATLRALPPLDRVGADPELCATFTGFGGGSYDERLDLSRSLAGNAPSGLPPSKLETDAVADGRAIASASAMAELNFRLAGAARVHFPFDSEHISPSDAEAVGRLAAWLKANRDAAVVLRGHSDETGPESYNLVLAERRASRVRSKLVAAGIEESRISELAVGEMLPAPGLHSTYADDRRVEMLLVLPLSEVPMPATQPVVRATADGKEGCQ